MKQLHQGQEVSRSTIASLQIELSLIHGDRVADDCVQTQRDQGDGIIPGGRGRTTIFIDTSTVSSTLLLCLCFFASLPMVLRVSRYPSLLFGNLQ